MMVLMNAQFASRRRSAASFSPRTRSQSCHVLKPRSFALRWKASKTRSLRLNGTGLFFSSRAFGGLPTLRTTTSPSGPSILMDASFSRSSAVRCRPLCKFVRPSFLAGGRPPRAYSSSSVVLLKNERNNASPVRASNGPDLPLAFVVPRVRVEEGVFEGRGGVFKGRAAFALVFNVFFRVVVVAMGHPPSSNIGSLEIIMSVASGQRVRMRPRRCSLPRR